MKLLAYGTLREGDYNFDRIKAAFGENSIKKVGEKKVSGFKMHNLGFYPAIVKGDGEITCDILEVNDKAATFIERMEVGAGYKKVVVEGLPIYEAARNLSGVPVIESGDWMNK